jgi:hypothetical protein
MTYSGFTRFAVVTEIGIMYQAVFYSCPQAIKSQWFDKARQSGAWAVDVLIRSENKDRIYILIDNEITICDRIVKVPEDHLRNVIYFSKFNELREMRIRK